MCRLAVLLAFLWLSLPAQATTIIRSSLDDMIGKSTLIVRGRVLRSAAQRNGNQIHTVVQVQVLEQLKGSAAAQVEFVLPGGNLGYLRQAVPGVPEFSAGAEHVFFLWTGKSGRTLLLGLGQGVLDFVKAANGETMVARQAIQAQVVDRGTGLPVDPEAIYMKYAEFRVRVRKVVGGSQ
jgi:hypothetical protein